MAKERRNDNERVVVLEVELKNINAKLDEHVVQQKDDFNALGTKIDSFIEISNTKVDKKVFDRLVGFALVSGVTIIGFLLKYTLFN